MQQRRITSSGLFRFKSTKDWKRIRLNPQHAEAMRECGVCQRSPHLVSMSASPGYRLFQTFKWHVLVRRKLILRIEFETQLAG